MSATLQVIALISGGKDSLYSILHCLANGHKVIALANLYPATPLPRAVDSKGRATRDPNQDRYRQDEEAGGEDEGGEGGQKGKEDDEDINSYMFQTVGHGLIPLYGAALDLPLYRRSIRGTAVDTSISYGVPPGSAEGRHRCSDDPSTHASLSSGVDDAEEEDETESLIPLLRSVLAAHPTANALCAGAILSTYQRTRIESVALRLGLIPLAYLWQYPALTWERGPRALLSDMRAVGMDARIVKVAGGGLGPELLGQNVLDEMVGRRVEVGVSRFSERRGDGAVLGEGGEYETIVVDGPAGLWESRIEIGEHGWDVIKGDGGCAAAQARGARLVEKVSNVSERFNWSEKVKIPDILDQEFRNLLQQSRTTSSRNTTQIRTLPQLKERPPILGTPWATSRSGSVLTVSNMTAPSPSSDAAGQLQNILKRLSSILQSHGTNPSSVISVTMLLKSMSSFASINPVYGSFYTAPNPPARVTIACGDLLPADVHMMLSVTVHLAASRSHRGLHVQSRSYWAPANIGPYSQAIGVSLDDEMDRNEEREYMSAERPEMIYIAGQIPLVPATMEMAIVENFNLASNGPIIDSEDDCFAAQTALSLQHIWRVGRAMEVGWWCAGLAFISQTSAQETTARVSRALETWEKIHDATVTASSADGEQDIDLWAMKYGRAVSTNCSLDETDWRQPLPDLARVDGGDKLPVLLCFVAQVSELPRNASIEWISFGLGKCQVQVRTVHYGDSLLLHETTVIGTKTTILWVGIAEPQQLDELDKALEERHQTKGRDPQQERSWRCLCTIYAGYGFPSVWLQKADAQVVPCQRVWNSDGEELIGIVQITSHGRSNA